VLRAILSIAALLIAFPLTSAAGKKCETVAIATGENRFFVILVDFSSSTKNARADYRNFVGETVDSVGPGDRFVVGPITENTIANFAPIAQADLPRRIERLQTTFEAWNENPIDRESCLAQLEKANGEIEVKRKDKIGAEMKKADLAFQTPANSPKTSILSSLQVASSIFDGDKREKILVILSDMLEDAGKYNFEELNLTADKDLEILAEQQSAGLPDLQNVVVCVAGAAASDPGRFRAVEDFWLLYFRETHADASKSRYAHTLLNCPRGSARPVEALQPAATTHGAVAPSASPCESHFGLGSDRMSVLATQGAPTRMTPDSKGEKWYYGQSFVRFSRSGRVLEFFNAGNLRRCS
jgi:hypothetical protein